MTIRAALMTACAVLALTACDRKEAEVARADPAPADARSNPVDPLIAEALIASRTPDAGMVEDPCGSGRGPQGASIPWVNAELVRRGHTTQEVCQLFSDGKTAAERIRDLPLDEVNALLELMDERADLMRQVTDAQAREIEKIANGG